MTVASRLQSPLDVWERGDHIKQKWATVANAAPLLSFFLISCLSLCWGSSYTATHLSSADLRPCALTGFHVRELCGLYGSPLLSLNTGPLPNRSNYNGIRWDRGRKFGNKFSFLHKAHHNITTTRDKFRVGPLWWSSSILIMLLLQGTSNLLSPHWCFRGPQLLSDCIPLFHQSKHCLSSGNIFTAP